MARQDQIPLWMSETSAQTDSCAVDSTAEEVQLLGGGTACSELELSPLRMGDEESELFDCLAKEVVDISGIAVEWYSLDLEGSVRDPVYDEPIEMAWKGPYQLKAHVTMNERNAEAREEGMVWTFSFELWVARAEVEEKYMARPKEGDVVRLWNVPFFDQFGSGNSTIDGAGFFFSVTRVESDGHLFDGPTFTGFKCELKRNTTFAPERMVFGDGVQRVV